MDMNKTITFMLALLLVITSAAGCAEKPAAPAKRVVARINSYELTAEDFNDEARLTAANKHLPADSAAAKAEILDEIIMKKVLLQEAQAQNFDKDARFMKEIERYWEQALIKLMIRKKMDEFASAITVGEDEVKAEYDRLSRDRLGKIGSFESLAPVIRDDMYQERMRNLFDDWMKRLKVRSAIKIYKENL
jgi:hypothetical protein